MQEFEFVIETGKIYALRTKAGEKTDLATVRMARDMYKEGLISREEAVMRVNPEQLKQLLHPVFQHTDEELFSIGLPASPGTSVGQIVFSANDASLNRFFIFRYGFQGEKNGYRCCTCNCW